MVSLQLNSHLPKFMGASKPPFVSTTMQATKPTGRSHHLGHLPTRTQASAEEGFKRAPTSILRMLARVSSEAHGFANTLLLSLQPVFFTCSEGRWTRFKIGWSMKLYYIPTLFLGFPVLGLIVLSVFDVEGGRVLKSLQSLRASNGIGSCAMLSSS